MKLVLGVTGSVASKLTPKLVSAILETKPDIEMRVVATKSTLYFFRREEVSVPIIIDSDEWPRERYVKDQSIPHIDLGDWADTLLIAPLSADTLSDMAHGKTDKLLTSLVLAWPREKPIILAPAMNTRMWENPITRDNLEIVQLTYRTTIVEPVKGVLACGTEGIGAMAKIEDIIRYL